MSTLRRVSLGVLAGLALWAAGLMQPAVSRACLPYDPPRDFAFGDGFEFVMIGTVAKVLEQAGLIQPRVGIEVNIEQVISGPRRATLRIGLDPGGGCARPPGEVGDRLVVARGVVINGVQDGEAGAMELSPYNTAIWVIAEDGRVTTGPLLDGRRPATQVSLLRGLAAMSNTAMPAPRGPLTVIGWILVVAAFAWAAARRSYSAH